MIGLVNCSALGLVKLTFSSSLMGSIKPPPLYLCRQRTRRTRIFGAWKRERIFRGFGYLGDGCSAGESLIGCDHTSCVGTNKIVMFGGGFRGTLCGYLRSWTSTR